MSQKIDQAGSRENLKPRREPYWQRVTAGCYVGFRKMAAGSKGAWIARSRSEDTGKQAITLIVQCPGMILSSTSGGRTWTRTTPKRAHLP